MDKTRQELINAHVAELLAQGYNIRAAKRQALNRYPTPAQARMRVARQARRKGTKTK